MFSPPHPTFSLPSFAPPCGAASHAVTHLGVWYIDTCNFDNILRSMGKDNLWVPVTRMDKDMGKNSYPRMDMGKLVVKIFSRG